MDERADLGKDPEIVDQLRHFGFSSICNTLAAIKTAKQLDLGSDDVVISVATDGSDAISGRSGASRATSRTPSRRPGSQR